MTTSDVNQFGGSWTREKLQILRGYLEAYTTALKRQNFTLVYVDAFAGTGYVNIGPPNDPRPSGLLISGLDEDAARVFMGSTRLALEVNDRPFDRFLFIEQNPAYASELRKLQSEFPDRDILVERAEANAYFAYGAKIKIIN